MGKKNQHWQYTHTAYTAPPRVATAKRAHTISRSNSMLFSCKNWIESIQTEISCTVQRAGKCMHSFHTTTRLPSSTTYWIRQGRILTTSCNGRRRLTELNLWANGKKSISVDNKHTHCIHCKTTRIVFSLFTLMFKYDYLPKRKDEVTNTKTKYQLPAAMADDDWLNLWATTTTSTADMLRCRRRNMRSEKTCWRKDKVSRNAMAHTTTRHSLLSSSTTHSARS